MTDKQQEFRYAAFISYRHTEPDIGIAKRLHTELETYHAPKKLVREKGCPARIGRVFRDQEELPTSGDLSASIVEALRGSRFLIVICSPRTPLSQWVAREIEMFQALGRGGRILTLLIEGEPSEAFPPLLFTRFVNSITRNEEDTEPLAADIRTASPKETLRKLKVEKLRLLAPILGCGFDDLRQREQERQLHQARRIAAGALAGVALFAGLAWDNYRERQKAETATGLALQAIHKLTFELPERLKDIPGTLKIIRQTFEENIPLLDVSLEIGSDTPSGLSDKATNFSRMGDVWNLLGDTAKARESYRQSLGLLESLTKQQPGNIALQHNLAVLQSKLGDALGKNGDITGALDNYRLSRALLERLNSESSNNADLECDLALAYYKSSLTLARKQEAFTGEFAETYGKNLALRKKLGERCTNRPEWLFFDAQTQRSRRVQESIMLNKGDIAAAIRDVDVDLQKSLQLAKEQPFNRQRGYSVYTNYLISGLLYQTQGNLDQALECYNNASNIIKALAEQDSDNAQWLQDSSSVLLFSSQILTQQGKYDEAEHEARSGLDIVQRLNDLNPKNKEWQLGVSGSHMYLGKVYYEHGKFVEALSEYKLAIQIIEKLFDESFKPEMAWEYLRRQYYEETGDSLARMEQWTEAEETYRRFLELSKSAHRFLSQEEEGKAYEAGIKMAQSMGLENAEKIKMDKLSTAAKTMSIPADPTAFNDLLTAHIKLGDVLVQREAFDDAILEYRNALELIEGQLKHNSSNFNFKHAQGLIYYRIGDALYQQDKSDEAIAELNKGLAIVTTLAQNNPNKPRLMYTVWTYYSYYGDAVMKLNAPKDAIVIHKNGLGFIEPLAGMEPSGIKFHHDPTRFDIAERLTPPDPGNAEWRRDLAITHRKISEAYVALNDIKNALSSRNQAIEILKKIMVAVSGDAKSKQELAENYGWIAWYELLNHRPQKALAGATKGVETDPEIAWIKVNLAHAYLFGGHYEQAKAIYLENRDFQFSDGRTFAQTVLDDFNQLKEKGITHPNMAKLEKILKK